MKVLIVDDDLHIREYLSKIIKDLYPYWNVCTCDTFEQTVSLATEHTYDMFILDYELDNSNPDKNGIALGLTLQNMPKYQSTPIVFETSYTEHVFDAVNNLNCVYYLTKPYDTPQVITMLDKILHHIPQKITLTLKDEYGIFTYIRLEDIIYVEANRHKLTIHMPDTTFICASHNLESLADLSDGSLIRCHKSFLINKNYITHVDKINMFVTLAHPSSKERYTIALGRSYKTALQ